MTEQTTTPVVGPALISGRSSAGEPRSLSCGAFSRRDGRARLRSAGHRDRPVHRRSPALPVGRYATGYRSTPELVPPPASQHDPEEVSEEREHRKTG